MWDNPRIDSCSATYFIHGGDHVRLNHLSLESGTTYIAGFRSWHPVGFRIIYAMEAMAHKNRWFTYEKCMVICNSYVNLPEGNRYLKDVGSNSISHGIFQWCSLLPTATLFRSEKWWTDGRHWFGGSLWARRAVGRAAGLASEGRRSGLVSSMYSSLGETFLGFGGI